MIREFKGRIVLAGNIQGEAVVSHEGLNILASFQKSVLKKILLRLFLRPGYFSIFYSYM